MYRRRERPEPEICPEWNKREFNVFRNKDHKWNYSWNWNGNDRNVLPFVETKRGIGRPGYRCYHCGKMAWDESDLAFAAEYAKNPYGIDVLKLICDEVERQTQAYKDLED